jgi:hypothetical protein
MLTFNNDKKVKAHYVARVRAHQKADEIIHGEYWADGKGCAVGCTIHGSDHSAYERELGIPRIIARLEDRIFEGMNNGKSQKFPLRFIQAVPVGKDLDKVWRKFFIWLLIDKKDGVINYAKKESTKKAIKDVADLLKRSLTEKISLEQFTQVRHAADAAAAAAYTAAAYTAYAAAYAADAAAYAAYAAAHAAYTAAAYAAYTAAAYAAYAAAYAAYAAAARTKKYEAMADKLIKLLKAA